MTSAAIYARVSSARQHKDETIGSQTAAQRAHAAACGLAVPEEDTQGTRADSEQITRQCRRRNPQGLLDAMTGSSRPTPPARQ